MFATGRDLRNLRILIGSREETVFEPERSLSESICIGTEALEGLIWEEIMLVDKGGSEASTCGQLENCHSVVEIVV